MNIFVLHESPKFAASMHCDKHVVKMIVESGQMLSTAHWINGSPAEGMHLYKPAFVNHPCSRWIRHSSANHCWLVRLFIGLLDEFRDRYGHEHSARRLVEHVSDVPGLTEFGPLTPFAQAMPDQYKNENAVVAYRHYYWAEKRRFAEWRYSPAPNWWPKLDVLA